MAFPAYAKLVFDPAFGRARDPGVVRTEMESGPAKQVPVKSRVMIERPVIYDLDSLADYNNFITWYETTIRRVGWFDWTDPVDTIVKQARIKGGAITEEKARRKTLDRWRVGFTLETWGT